MVLSCTSGTHLSKSPGSPSHPTEAIHETVAAPAPDPAFHRPTPQPHAVSFEDRTAEIVQRAEILIARNKREGAILDQHWYGFRRFGKYQDLILGATQVIICGGLEVDVRTLLGSTYQSYEPVEPDQDPGEVRLYIGRRSDRTWDFILIGQNGREIALKTAIRILYMREFVSNEIRRKYAARLSSFPNAIKVLLSSIVRATNSVLSFTAMGSASSTSFSSVL